MAKILFTQGKLWGESPVKFPNGGVGECERCEVYESPHAIRQYIAVNQRGSTGCLTCEDFGDKDCEIDFLLWKMRGLFIVNFTWSQQS